MDYMKKTTTAKLQFLFLSNLHSQLEEILQDKPLSKHRENTGLKDVPRTSNIMLAS